VAVFIFCLFAALSDKVSGKATTASSGQPGQNASRPVSVVLATAREGDLKVVITGIGTVTALHTVTVRSRVDGELKSLHFREGQEVSRGSLLAIIDQGPFKAQLAQAVGQLDRDLALLANARHDLARYDALWKQNAVPRQQFDTQKSLVTQLQGTIKVDRGLVGNARLQLAYTRITAPLDGRVGLKLVDPGNIIQAADPNGLVVITQIRPIAVVFPVPEDNLPAILEQLSHSELLSVGAYDRNDSIKLAEGHLLALDNRIDTATGTVRLKAVFPNDSNELFPNQFVNVRLLLGVKRNAIIVPQAALRHGPKGAFVYRVKRDSTVQTVAVAVGRAEKDSVSIDSGLSPGDSVVVEGGDRLHEGSIIATGAPAAHDKEP
jgi:multidrug efflux system membrane fusion protein